jgi:heme/copper-type cytochrome/quinol oxidase subunit 2
MKKNLSTLFVAALLLFGVFTFVYAQAGLYENPIKILDANGAKVETIPQFLLLLVDLVFLFGMPIIVLFIIYAGFLFVTAGDNESQISKAKTTILWTLIGAAVLIGAKVIAMAIQTTVLSLA